MAQSPVLYDSCLVVSGLQRISCNWFIEHLHVMADGQFICSGGGGAGCLPVFTGSKWLSSADRQCV